MVALEAHAAAQRDELQRDADERMESLQAHHAATLERIKVAASSKERQRSARRELHDATEERMQKLAAELAMEEHQEGIAARARDEAKAALASKATKHEAALRRVRATVSSQVARAAAAVTQESELALERIGHELSAAETRADAAESASTVVASLPPRRGTAGRCRAGDARPRDATATTGGLWRR